jgi:calcineurin-like phosphoesterase
MIERFLTRMPARFEVPNNPAVLCGVWAEIDGETGRTVGIARIQERAA